MTSLRHSNQSFPEDSLPRLAKSLRKFTPIEYHAYILSLYEPRTSTGKVKKVAPKGKFISKPTKSDKRPYGTYEIRYTSALGERKFEFKFDRALVPSINFVQLAKDLHCPKADLKEFLEKKKFALDKLNLAE